MYRQGMADAMQTAALMVQAFFTRWWHEQDQRMRRLVRRLVRDKQLGFVNGGYVQNDEATSHFVAMVDQTTRGHRSGPAVAAHAAGRNLETGRQPIMSQCLHALCTKLKRVKLY